MLGAVAPFWGGSSLRVGRGPAVLGSLDHAHVRRPQHAVMQLVAALGHHRHGAGLLAGIGDLQLASTRKGQNSNIVSCN